MRTDPRDRSEPVPTSILCARAQGMGVLSVFSYQDALDPDLAGILDDIRKDDGDDEPVLLSVAGWGKSGLVATQTRLYVLRAGYLMTHRWNEAYVGTHPLSDLTRLDVETGWLYARCTLHFADPQDADAVPARLRDRDKWRLAGRMLLHWAQEARALDATGTRGHRTRVQGAVRGTGRVGASRSDFGIEGTERHNGGTVFEAPREAAAARISTFAQGFEDPAGDLLDVPASAAPVDGASQPIRASAADAVSILRSLWELAQSGAITAEEFHAKKAELLRRV